MAPVNETDIVLLPEGLKALKRVSEETKKLLECLHERLRELYIQPGMPVLDIGAYLLQRHKAEPLGL